MTESYGDGYHIEMGAGMVWVHRYYAARKCWTFKASPRWWLPWERSLTQARARALAYIASEQVIDAEFESLGRTRVGKNVSHWVG